MLFQKPPKELGNSYWKYGRFISEFLKKSGVLRTRNWPAVQLAWILIAQLGNALRPVIAKSGFKSRSSLKYFQVLPHLLIYWFHDYVWLRASHLPFTCFICSSYMYHLLHTSKFVYHADKKNFTWMVETSLEFILIIVAAYQSRSACALNLEIFTIGITTHAVCISRAYVIALRSSLVVFIRHFCRKVQWKKKVSHVLVEFHRGILLIVI